MKLESIDREMISHISHKLNSIANENYHYAHPIQDVVIDKSNHNSVPVIMDNPWYTHRGTKSNRKRIKVGESYLRNLINTEINNVKMKVNSHFLSEEE
jgi:hypothetical protein